MTPFSNKHMLLLLLPLFALLAGCVKVPTDTELARSVFRTVPLPPDTVIAAALSPDTVQVSWTVPQWASSYTLYYTDKDSLDSSAVVLNNLPIPFCKIGGFIADRRYRFAVRAINELGPSEVSPLSDFTLRADTVPPGMKRIPGGIFRMGSETGDTDEKPVHSAIVSSFYMDTTEVLRSDFDSLLHRNLAFNKDSVRAPAENLTWFDALLFCNVRSLRAGLDTAYTYDAATILPAEGCVALSNLVIHYERRAYRLPTEAEWEYACRGGTISEFYWGEAPTGLYAHFYAYSISDPPREDSISENVAGYLPNGYGLYDMSGNVREWCGDWYGPAYYGVAPLSNPTGPAVPNPNDYKVCRGGGSVDYKIHLTSSYRRVFKTTRRLSTLGFRTVLPKP